MRTIGDGVRAGGFGGLLALICLGALAAAPAPAQPAVTLGVEVRVVDAPSAAGPTARPGDVVVGTRGTAPDSGATMQVQVQNGQWAQLRVDRDLPLQWLQAAAAANPASGNAAPGAAGAGRSTPRGSVVYGLTWMHAGQALEVRPTWPGGRGGITADIRYETSAVDDETGAALPVRRRMQAATTLRVAPGQWTTFATLGEPGAGPQEANETTISTASRPGRGRQLMQLRVTLP